MSSRAFETTINAAADAEGVPRAVAQALADTEGAARDPRWYGDEAYGGGYGLMHVTLRTARGMGFVGAPEQLYDPALNARLALRYLRSMLQTVGGGWDRAYAAYNAGPDLSPYPTQNVERFTRNLERWVAEYGGFRQPSILRAGIGGEAPALMLLPLLWFLSPRLSRRRRRRRKGRR